MTAERTGLAAAGAPVRPPETRRRVPLEPIRHPLQAIGAACVALAALSLLLPSAPTYDPMAWLIWGREIAHLGLSTTDGPSWKPLPVAFTTLFAPTGSAAPWLWLVVARSGGLIALAMSYRVAARLAGRAAGLIAAAGLALSHEWMRDSWLGNSEGVLLALLLLAVDRHLSERPRQALVLGFLAGLLRPEAWPFLGLYGLWLWVRRPALRRLGLVLAALTFVLWFVPEEIGSGDLLRASARARMPATCSTRPRVASSCASVRAAEAPSATLPCC